MSHVPGAMSAEDWNSCVHISPAYQHNWGDRNRIDRRVILTVNELAGFLSQPVLVTSGSSGAHVSGSYHYATDKQLGLALDIMFPHISRRQLPDILLQVLRFPFTGVGIYSEWSLAKGHPSLGGFHVDFRPTYLRALWLKGLHGYEALTQDNLRRYFY